MKTNLSQIYRLCSMIMLCSVILTGCEDNEMENLNSSFIRPCRLDMTGVKGFVITSNASNTPSTRMGNNENGYSLYSIDENGNLHLSIFYFEIVGGKEGGSNEQNVEVMTELSNALQIVPSLVTDLGKYILFSGCKYQIATSGISDRAQAVCDSFLGNNWQRNNVFMIRKSDGALFDLSNQPIFTYCYFDGYSWWFNDYCLETYNPVTGSGERWSYIPSYTYATSAKGNLFVKSWKPSQISRIENKGDSVRVKQMTHSYSPDYFFSFLRTFAVDKDENIYEFFGSGSEERPAKGAQLDIYYADGRFNVYNFSDFKSNLHDYSYSRLFDFVTDESGTPYIFLLCRIENNDGSHSETVKLYFLSANMEEGVVSLLGEDFVNSDYYTVESSLGWEPINRYYLGCYNNCFNWYLPIRRDEQGRPSSTSPDEVISYNKSTNQWSSKMINSGLMQIITADYDVWISGKKCYGVNVKGNNIEVTAVDIVSEISNTYTFSIDLSSIISPNYKAITIQDIPYLIIDGRSATDGTGVSFMINLINGDNNSTFASDNRSVVSFFRIN